MYIVPIKIVWPEKRPDDFDKKFASLNNNFVEAFNKLPHENYPSFFGEDVAKIGNLELDHALMAWAYCGRN